MEGKRRRKRIYSHGEKLLAEEGIIYESIISY